MSCSSPHSLLPMNSCPMQSANMSCAANATSKIQTFQSLLRPSYCPKPSASTTCSGHPIRLMAKTPMEQSQATQIVAVEAKITEMNKQEGKNASSKTTRRATDDKSKGSDEQPNWLTKGPKRNELDIKTVDS